MASIVKRQEVKVPNGGVVDGKADVVPGEEVLLPHVQEQKGAGRGQRVLASGFIFK